MIKIFFALILLLNFAAAKSNLEVVTELFTDENFDQASYLRGELRGQSKHEFYAKDRAEINITSLGEGDEFEVFRVNLKKFSNGENIDLYVYAREGELYMIRTLAMTGAIFGAIKEYERANKKPKEVDIKNLKLIVASDGELVKFGRENEAKFERIFELHANKAQNLERELKELHLSHVDDEFIFCLIIGGVLDNTVGFMRAAREEDVPKMSPSRYIMIERLSPNSKWYLFKTT